MSEKAFVEEQISSNKVVVFSKSYCPYCKKAKAALFGIIPESSVIVIELDHRGDGDAIQDALLGITGRRSVPQVFIGGKFFGGGDETAEAAANGSLSQALNAQEGQSVTYEL